MQFYISNSTHIQPPFDETYYQRRCTIRFCIIGLSSLLLSSASLSMVILLRTRHSFALVLSLLSLLPFIVHSLLLIWAIILLRSNRKNMAYISQCGIWSTTSKWLSPTIMLEVVALRYWGFDMCLPILTVVSFGIAVYKVNNIMAHVIIPCIIESINLQAQRNQPMQESLTTNDDELQVQLQNEGETVLPPPSYDEAIKNENTDPPPDYNEVILLHHQSQ